jgi:hypothetical protein
MTMLRTWEVGGREPGKLSKWMNAIIDIQQLFNVRSNFVTMGTPGVRTYKTALLSQTSSSSLS